MKVRELIKSYPYFTASVVIGMLISGISFYFNIILGAVEAVSVIFIGLFGFIRLYKSAERKRNYVKILSDSLSATHETGSEISSFPVPVLLADKNDSIVWFNDRFSSIMGNFDNIKKCSLSEIIPEKKAFDENGNPAEFFEMKNNRSQFTVFTSQPDDNLVFFFFVDDTQLKKFRTMYRATRPVCLLINIDSLEQAEDVMPHEDYYGLNSDIDRLITKWLVDNGCVFRKFSDGRFFALTEYKNLTNLISERFSIIDKVRQAHFGGADIDVTLSIGVGCADEMNAAEDEAREALDMARGRGGDQAAVKMNGNYEFFGGVTAGKEKRGKVKARAFASALDEYIGEADNIIVMGHAFSDFDCVGAAAGISLIAQAKNKPCAVVANKNTTMALPLIDNLIREKSSVVFISPEEIRDNIYENTLLVVVDTMRESLLESKDILSYNLKTVIIDHHRMPVDHITGNVYEFLEPFASSASEMVTELVQYSPSKPVIGQPEAEALLAGIMLDTKDFTLRVGVRTFEAASVLKAAKADTVNVRKLFSGSAEINILVNNTVNGARYFDGYAVAVCTADKDARLVASKAADELLTINNTDAAFVICEFPDYINISARSYGKVNVQLIMEKLGGGGHHSMAAAQLKEVTVEQAEQILHEKIKEYFDTVNKENQL